MFLLMHDFLPGCLFAVVVIKCFMMGVNVWWVYLAPQNIPRAISVLTLGNKVILHCNEACWVDLEQAELALPNPYWSERLGIMEWTELAHSNHADWKDGMNSAGSPKPCWLERLGIMEWTELAPGIMEWTELAPGIMEWTELAPKPWFGKAWYDGMNSCGWTKTLLFGKAWYNRMNLCGWTKTLLFRKAWNGGVKLAAESKPSRLRQTGCCLLLHSGKEWWWRMLCMVAGWQWDPKDRPTFKEIHYLLENMFEKSSISEGRQLHLSFSLLLGFFYGVFSFSHTSLFSFRLLSLFPSFLTHHFIPFLSYSLLHFFMLVTWVFFFSFRSYEGKNLLRLVWCWLQFTCV